MGGVWILTRNPFNNYHFWKNVSFIHSHLSCSFSSNFRKFLGFLWLEVSCPKPQLATWNLQIANLSEQFMRLMQQNVCTKYCCLCLIGFFRLEKLHHSSRNHFFASKDVTWIIWYKLWGARPFNSSQAFWTYRARINFTSPSLGLCATLVGSRLPTNIDLGIEYFSPADAAIDSNRCTVAIV